jgi:hypothetical protein
MRERFAAVSVVCGLGHRLRTRKGASALRLIECFSNTSLGRRTMATHPGTNGARNMRRRGKGSHSLSHAHTVLLLTTPLFGDIPWLMYGGKYSAVIGRETHFVACARYEFPSYGCFEANHSAVFTPVPLVHQKPRNFAKQAATSIKESRCWVAGVHNCINGLPYRYLVGVKTKRDVRCKMVRSDWPTDFGCSPRPGQSRSLNSRPLRCSPGRLPRYQLRPIRSHHLAPRIPFRFHA